MKADKFYLEPHICRNCGGRILRHVNGGVTPGGNPVFRCADCGQSGAAMHPANLCWCGFSFKGHFEMNGTYMCMPFSVLKEKPWLRDAFLSCGCNPDNGKSEIGVLTQAAWKQAEEKRGTGE